jgi:hypothetical protein
MKIAVAFGLEYLGQSGELRGCKRDAEEFSSYLREKRGYDKVKVCTSDAETGAYYMIHKMYKMALNTWRSPGAVKEVCIYYSGHGSHMPDRDRDERDGRDECLIPTDYHRAGVITDDLLKRVFRYFHPETNVVFIVDACHSGSMCDLKYKLDESTRSSVEAHPASKCNARITSISGCKDDEVSYVGYNLLDEGKRRSVLTAFLLKTLNDEKKETIHEIQETLVGHVVRSGYAQHPEVMTSFPVFEKDTVFCSD